MVSSLLLTGGQSCRSQRGAPPASAAHRQAAQLSVRSLKRWPMGHTAHVPRGILPDPGVGSHRPRPGVSAAVMSGAVPPAPQKKKIKRFTVSASTASTRARNGAAGDASGHASSRAGEQRGEPEAEGLGAS